MRLREIAGFAGAVALLAAGLTAFAADGVSTGARTRPGATEATAATPESHMEDKIASEFAIFAGSRENARSLVAGLRKGGEVTLVTPSSSSPSGASTTFSPPTRPMGNGNVRISLALAQEQLIRLGITRPTAEQVRASLVGETITTGSGPTAKTTELRGVLEMRAQGMGWGQIAGAMGTKLGHVMSGLKQTNRQLAAGQPVPGAGTAGAATPPRGNGRGAHTGASTDIGAGVVTAAGSPAATSAPLQASADARGTDLETGAGSASAGSRAPASGPANGKGYAKP